MAAMSDYLEEKFLKAVLRGEAFPTFSSVWLGLALVTAFTDASYATEVTQGGYARAQLTAGFTVSGVGGQWIGSLASTVGIGPATEDWGSPPSQKVVGWGLFDADVAGHHLFHGSLDSPLPMFSGNVFVLDTGQLTIEAK